MTQYTADHIANAIIHLSRKRGIQDVTNLKLQKLLYYAQAWFLVFCKRPLFDDAIEAWVHGPVVPSVFRRFKSYGWSVIDCGVPVPPPVNEQVLAHLGMVLHAYGSVQATRLERLTHQESPWKDARKGIAIDEPSHNVIQQAAMREFYLKALHTTR